MGNSRDPLDWLIAIIAIAAYAFTRKINGHDLLLWGIFVALVVITAVLQTKLTEFFLLAGILVLLLMTPTA